MEITDSETYRQILEAEILRHSMQAVDLLIEDDIAAWAAERQGNMPGNPPAAAIVNGEDGSWCILLRRTIDSDWVPSILDRIEFGGFSRAKEILSTPEMFLKHLVLHELAHLMNDWRQDKENECDGWAFEKLGVNAI